MTLVQLGSHDVTRWHRPPQPQQRLVDASAGQRGAPEEEEEEEETYFFLKSSAIV